MEEVVTQRGIYQQVTSHQVREPRTHRTLKSMTLVDREVVTHSKEELQLAKGAAVAIRGNHGGAASFG